MGGGTYSIKARLTRAENSGYYTLNSSDLFTQTKKKKAHPDMLVYGKIRESRDSEEHPTSIPVIIALDVTGSMLQIPMEFIRDGMPGIMGKLQQAGIEHPQICFSAVGDHECDSFPFQAGQFESSDELIDKWLQLVYLESGGGGNAGESYALAWKFAADHCLIDSFEKRGQKGFLFSIGDEPNLRQYPSVMLDTLFGGQNYAESDYSLFEKASKQWNIHHIFLEHGSKRADGRWSQILGDNLHVVKHHSEIPLKIAEIMVNGLTTQSTSVNQPQVVTTETEPVKITL